MVADNFPTSFALVSEKLYEYTSSSTFLQEFFIGFNPILMDPFSLRGNEDVLAAAPDSSTSFTQHISVSNTSGIYPLEALNKCVESMAATSEYVTNRFDGKPRSSDRVGKSRNTRTGPRRHKANARERQRMHGLNDALDNLRRRVPIISENQKLSKIETLRLARNYIFLLDRMLNENQSGPLKIPSSTETSNTLTRGLSQTTSNVIQSLLGIHSRPCIPYQQSPTGRSDEDGGALPRSRLQGSDYHLNGLLASWNIADYVESAPSESGSVQQFSDQQPRQILSEENNLWDTQFDWDSESFDFDGHSGAFD